MIQALQFQNGFLNLTLSVKAFIVQILTDHVACQVLLGQFRSHCSGSDKYSVFNDGICIADLQHLIELMGNEDQADTSVLYASHDIKHAGNLRVCQRSGRLVHDDDLCIFAHGLSDFDDLLAGSIQILHQCIGR